MADIELILGNSNKRFSGVTSTMLQVLSVQKDLIPTAVMGPHHLAKDTPVLNFWQTAKLCRKPLPDGRSRVFHARRNDEMIQALLLKKLFGAKLKIAFTSTAQRHHSGLTKYLISQVDGIISTCSAAASYLERKPDIIVPHGIDESIYSPAAEKAKAWQELGYPGKYGIGIFGRVRHQKGIDVLVDAVLPLLEKHPDFTVIIGGEITPSNKAFVDEQKAKAENAGVGERLMFIGKQPFERLPILFRSMSIVAALSRNEGFGLTVLEAMASGTAVIASEAGAWKDIITDDSLGYCVPCGDVHATREKLDLMMADPERLLQLGVNGRKHVEQHYTIQREATQLTDYLRSLA
ncbi:mannosyltransferase [Rubritalea squalenifaciens DSM 18772]|uniref:Mannosyltransferase n=1 Tax=Rubritalea squalenifaciens DSM 18772 TaxID=1123071 RepID=A0A1M6EGJ4_9BACT|nr:glycosyltransferase family 4 protein [Rubritalea squalenifaciens]SHI84509.1 mannosyltransferase [Rubritalea squalenifaciens DSM 18772]